MKANKILNDFFNDLQTYKIPCVLDRNKIIETTFYTTILSAGPNKRDSIYFSMPDSLFFNVNLYQDCRIDVSLLTKTRILDRPSEIYSMLSHYSKKWHYFNDLYSEFFKSRVESINANVNRPAYTDEDVDYLNANKLQLSSDYDMLTKLSSI